MKLVLHSYWRSSASHRVRIGLGLKELAYEYVVVNLLKGDQSAEPYRKYNPLAQVPTLELVEDDGTRRSLTQSLPILEFLDERWPELPILPKDLYLRARARALAEIVNSAMQPFQNISTARKIKAMGGDDKAWTRGYLTDGLAAFAHFASETAGAFCVGDLPTIADCCLVPQLLSARRFDVDLTPYPQLLAIEERCLALPAFASAMPDRQPDAVKS